MNPEINLDKQDKAEINNYTRTPNMLIFGYHDTLSPQEKWLYVCLKHLCGKKGTRHLSLRYISEQTGISTGALSASKNKKGEVNPGMIKHLHTAGLIHAEIKKPGKGNPQYHITITEVWALNQAFFRSEFGQAEDIDVEPVRNSDEPVHISDRRVQNSDRSVHISDEPVRNPIHTKITDKTIQDSYKITEQDTLVASQNFDATALAFSDTLLKELPDGDAVLLGWMADGIHHRIYRKSGKSLGELIPIGADIDAALQEFLTVESENDNHSYRHDHTRKEDDWACNNWRGAHKGKTCTDYQAYIDSGEREETPTEPRTPAIQIGATDGHRTPDHPAADHRAADSVRADGTPEQVAIANTPDGAVAPPTAAVRQSYTTSAREASSVPTEAHEGHGRNDGAATEVGSEPAPSGKQSAPKRQRKKPAEEPEPIPQEVLRILDDWDSLHKEPVPRTERLIAAAKLLEPTRPTRDELKGCRDWLPTTDRPGKPWYRSHGVKLADIAENITQYRQVLAMSIEPAPLADMKQPKPMDIYTAASLDPERTERNLEKLRQRRLAREAAAQQQGGVN